MSGKLYSKFDSIGKSHELDSKIESVTEAINTLQLITVDNVDQFTKNDLNLDFSLSETLYLTLLGTLYSP